MGLPVERFIAATNANDVVVEYLHSGRFQPRPSLKTISNAMDVGNPSNFARMLALYDGRQELMQRQIFGASFSDEATRQAIREIADRYDYLMDPHGAVGYLGLQDYLKSTVHPQQAVVCETAHPGKFIEVMQEILPGRVKITERLAEVLKKEKRALLLDRSFEAFKEFLLS